jgi:hypothetical protein
LREADIRSSHKSPTWPRISKAIMEATGLDKTHRDAVREIAARVLAQLHGLAKRDKIQRIGLRIGVSWVMPSSN